MDKKEKSEVLWKGLAKRRANMKKDLSAINKIEQLQAMRPSTHEEAMAQWYARAFGGKKK